MTDGGGYPRAANTSNDGGGPGHGGEGRQQVLMDFDRDSVGSIREGTGPQHL
jgi:hypothetical protein